MTSNIAASGHGEKQHLFIPVGYVQLVFSDKFHSRYFSTGNSIYLH